MTSKVDFIKEVMEIFSKFKTPAVEYFDKIDSDNFDYKSLLDKLFGDETDLDDTVILDKLHKMTDEKEIVDVIYLIGYELIDPVHALLLSKKGYKAFIRRMFF
jgi:hypothetical protein